MTIEQQIFEEGNKAVITIDRQKDFYVKDEVHCNWYKCPSCEDTYVKGGDNYCSNCGCKFEWSSNDR